MTLGNVPIDQRQASQYFGFAHEQLTIDDTVGGVPLTATTYVSGNKNAQVAYLTLEDADIRYTYDGTAPTTTAGHRMYVGETLTIAGHANIVAFRAIRISASSGELNVTYEG